MDLYTKISYTDLSRIIKFVKTITEYYYGVFQRSLFVKLKV